MRSIATGNEKTVTDSLIKNTDVKDLVSKEHHEIIKREIKLLCKKDNPSILRNHDIESLKNFSWSKVLKEWENVAPNFTQFLFTCSENPSQTKNKQKTRESIIPSIVSAGCKILYTYNRDLCAYQHLNGISMLRGGAKKRLFQRFSSTSDCVTYTTVLQKASNIGESWSDLLLEWKDNIQDDTSLKDKLQHEINTISVKTDNDAILCRSDLKSTLSVVKDKMHPGYKFVGDNVDLRTHARHTSRDYKDRDEHMFQINCVKNRINDPNLEMLKAQKDPDQTPFAELCPSADDISELKKNCAVLVAKTWCSYIPWLKEWKEYIPKHIVHKHMSESRQKTEKV